MKIIRTIAAIGTVITIARWVSRWANGRHGGGRPLGKATASPVEKQRWEDEGGATTSGPQTPSAVSSQGPIAN
ncbi:MAG TPA: hypothetical protein P5528_11205 [Steroidobacteraceae bacterium]|nr:hypothetical protein [Steroidobacteraceae bacterium]HRX89998.1 hypothetical protein [Steroidobacteraceae bacterium]